MVLFQKKWLKDSIGNHIFGVYVGGVIIVCVIVRLPGGLTQLNQQESFKMQNVDGHQTIGEFALLEFG